MMVNPYEFMHLFTKGATFKKHTKLIEGVPEDAEIIGITYDTRRDHILLVLESASYAPVKITDIPPIEVVSIQIGLPGATKKKSASRKKRK